MHIHCQIYKAKMVDLKGIFGNRGGCHVWLPTTLKWKIVVPSGVYVVVVGTNIVAFVSWHQ